MQDGTHDSGSRNGVLRLLATVAQLLALAGTLTALGLIAGGLVADLAMVSPDEAPAPRLAGSPLLPAAAAILLVPGGLWAAVAAVRARRHRDDDRWAEWRQRFLAG